MLYEISEKAIQLENEGKKIIKFNLGDPDQPTPHEIIEAAFEAMKQGKTKYSSSAGERKLREELASIHNVSADNVVITTGSKWAIFSIMFLLFEKRRKRRYSNPALD
jgi:Aspartate/tyrosine/aromatic aminotransferase